MSGTQDGASNDTSMSVACSASSILQLEVSFNQGAKCIRQGVLAVAGICARRRGAGSSRAGQSSCLFVCERGVGQERTGGRDTAGVRTGAAPPMAHVWPPWRMCGPSPRYAASSPSSLS